MTTTTRRWLVGLVLIAGGAGSVLYPARAEQAAPQVIRLWPSTAPGENEPVGPERYLAAQPNQREVQRLTDISEPTITVYRPAPERNTGAAVVIAPGGGYNILAWDLEGTEVAKWLNGLGVTGILLKYRVPRRPGQTRDQPPIGPLQDMQRAISMVRRRAAEWGIDPARIGALGFSAGGHLAAAAALRSDERVYAAIDAVDEVSRRPDFVVLIYPGYIVNREGTALSSDMKVTAAAPPMFLVHADDDPVPSLNSALLYAELKRNKVPAELHIYSKGGHGYGLRPSEDPVSSWPARCEAWMKRSGLLEKK